MNSRSNLETIIATTDDRSIVIECIMDEYGTVIKRLIFSYVKDWDIASDLTQEVFITCYEKLETFQQKSSFKTWIYRIAINKSKDYLKSWSYRNMVLNEKILFFKKDNNKGPDASIIDKEFSTELSKIIWDLPVKYREVILLYFYQEHTLHEISEMLTLPLSTVKSRLYRGQDRIKKMYLFSDRGEQHG
ncbi:sigma-70 family RNA polymerase sigma factor [Bacillus sp. 31A1R]|uniref:Sigma-70 family RNA polymerase sigma factor n=1 Tax=Robertmurraya mangrovi TaxID=3098077 RepID=A0ABU5IWS9_9BACI|nr:sigma-70 family RNA polymerase sigma factor [Bacillus sp. 31A1R]MDZ5471619.1 sigma-70 family RNA polymerase sigma factor [Bacillus sp. 31A1R]